MSLLDSWLPPFDSAIISYDPRLTHSQLGTAPFSLVFLLSVESALGLVDEILAFSGRVQQVGAFSMVLKDGDGKTTIVIPTKMLLDKEIVVESGPTPDTQERMTERSSAEPA